MLQVVGDIVFLIMTDNSRIETVYNKFKELAGNVNKEYSKDVEETMIDESTEDSEFTDDMDTSGGLGNPIFSVNEIQ